MNFECPICNDTGDAIGSEANGLCMVANCGHVFHIKCMNQWKTRGAGATCPTCRQICVKTWTLYGATTIAAESAKAKTNSTGGANAMTNSTGGTASGEGQDADINVLYATLREDYDRTYRQLVEARNDSRRRDRHSDDKDFLIVRLKSKLTEYERKFESLETDLALAKSLMTT